MHNLVTVFLLATAAWSPAHASIPPFAEFAAPDLAHHHGDQILVQGAGGASPGSLYADALFVYQVAKPRAYVTYKSLSSSRGKCRIEDYETRCKSQFNGKGSDNDHPVYIDYASSESLLKQSNYDSYPDLQMYPVIAGAVVPIVHIPGMNGTLRLSMNLLARIFRQCINDDGFGCEDGSIKSWAHPEILALNPDNAALLTGLGNITVIVRENGAGTSEIFKAAIAIYDDKFANQIELSSSANWNNSLVHRVDGQTNAVLATMQTPGAITYTYLNVASAFKSQLVGIVKDTSQPSTYVLPSIDSIAAALREKGSEFGNNGDDPARLTAFLSGALTKDSWPIVGYSYLVMRKQHLRPGSTCLNRIETVKYWYWFYTSDAVKQLADKFDMSVLPADLAQFLANKLVSDIMCPEGDGGWTQAYQMSNNDNIPLFSVVSMEVPMKLLLTGYSMFKYAWDVAPQLVHPMDTLEQFGTLANQLVDHDSGIPAIAFVPGLSVENRLPGSFSNALDNHLVTVVPFAVTTFVVYVNFCSDDPGCELYPTQLSLTVEVIANIFRGLITSWDDPHIRLLNPLEYLPAEPIELVLPDFYAGRLELEEFGTLVAGHGQTFAYGAASTKMPTGTREEFRLAVSTIHGGISVMPKNLLGINGVIEVAVISSNGYEFSSSLESAEACWTALRMSPQVSSYEFYIPATRELEEADQEALDCYPFAASMYLLFASNFEARCTQDDSIGVFYAGFINFILERDSVASALTYSDVLYFADNAYESELAFAEKRNGVKCNKESITNPPQDLSESSTFVKNLLTVAAIVMIVLSLMMMWWTYRFRSHSVIKCSTPSFMYQVLFGNIVIVSTVFLLLQDDTTIVDGETVLTTDITGLQVACKLLPFVYTIGFVLSFGPLVLKSWRITTLFENKVLKKINIANSTLMKYQGLLIGIVLIINLTWLLVDPLTWERAPITYGRSNNVLKSAGMCNCNNPWTWIGLFLTVKMVLLIIGNYYALAGRNVPVKFGEGKWIGFALSNMLQILLFSLPVLVTASDNPTTTLVARSLFVILMVLCTQLLVYLPKFKIVHFGEDVPLTSTQVDERKPSHYMNGRMSIGGNTTGATTLGVMNRSVKLSSSQIVPERYNEPEKPASDEGVIAGSDANTPTPTPEKSKVDVLPAIN